MIPRLRPFLGNEELLAVLRRERGAVKRFEQAFASTFDAKYALAFPYGRSALWALFKALGIQGAEIVMPAYTCVVVAHATVLSGNTPRFVDVSLYDYNMILDQLEQAINHRTRAIIATHLFGYPLDLDRLGQIVRDAEERIGHKIWVIQDCAHSFGARWKGNLVCNNGDAALFSLDISKMITSVVGGIITTNDAQLYERMQDFRGKNFNRPVLFKTIRRLIYLLALYPTFSEHTYYLVNWLERNTKFLDPLTKAYHLDDKIHFPPDYSSRMLELEAAVGLVQLKKYAEVVRRRQENARYYDTHLRGLPGLALPPIVDGATYSHYVVRVDNRESVLSLFRRFGVQLGELIEYSIPAMNSFAPYANQQSFPNAMKCSQSTINLPVYACLTDSQRAKIAEIMREQAVPWLMANLKQ